MRSRTMKSHSYLKSHSYQFILSIDNYLLPLRHTYLYMNYYQWATVVSGRPSRKARMSSPEGRHKYVQTCGCSRRRRESDCYHHHRCRRRRPPRRRRRSPFLRVRRVERTLRRAWRGRSCLTTIDLLRSTQGIERVKCASAQSASFPYHTSTSDAGAQLLPGLPFFQMSSTRTLSQV